MNLVPQFGFLELLLIGVVALVVVGPKDLPKLMRAAGRFVARARAMAGEFTAAFDQMSREADMEELRAEIETLKTDNVFAKTKREIDDSLAPVKKELREEEAEIRRAASSPVAGRAPEKAPEES